MTDLYAALGVARDATGDEIRVAYRNLARRWHPDHHGNSPEANERLREINAAYEILGDPVRRAASDHAATSPTRERGAREVRKIAQDVRLRVEEFLRGATLTVRVKDPAEIEAETYALTVPEETAPGTRFRIPRTSPGGGVVVVRVLLQPGRFKARGSDLRCDLRISAQRAERGGTETLPGATGRLVRVEIPPGVARGAVLRVAGEGLPKPRGGRGDLLVRVSYRVEARINRGQAKPGFRRLR